MVTLIQPVLMEKQKGINIRVKMKNSIKEFIDYISLEKKYSIHTIKAYKKDLFSFEKFCKIEFNIKNIDYIEYSTIRNWIIFLVDNQNSNRSVNRRISVLRSYYKFLIGIGVIKISPLSLHTPLKESKSVQIPFSEKEIKKLLDSSYFPNNYNGFLSKIIIKLFYFTGIRRSELINIKLFHVDFSKRVLKVIGKQNKERLIPIINELEIELKEYLILRKKIKKIHDNDFLLLTNKGKILGQNFVYKTVNNYISLVSTKAKRSPHMLRHSFATHLLNNGANLNSVKELLGHASLASTQVYTHTSMKKIKEIYSITHPRNKK